jgi:signal transduction histidine kinase/CheY-like chemotaxis protein
MVDRTDVPRDLLLATLENVPAGVAVLRGEALVYEYVNALYRRLVPGIGEGDAFGLSSPQGTRLRELAADAMRTGEPYMASELAVDFLGPTARRGYFDLTLQPLRGKDGRCDAIIVLGVEVTRLVEARRALEVETAHRRSADQQLQAILANAPLLIFAFDRSGLVTLAAGRELKRLELQEGALLGTSIWERYADDPVILGNCRRALAGESFVAMVRKGTQTFEVRYSPLRDEGGSVAGVIGVAFNATARLEAEAERARLQEKMLQSQKLESLGILAGGVAHDFNNLLTVIHGNASLARDRVPPQSPAHPLIDDVIKASQRAAGLTRQMLAYSGQTRYLLRPLDLPTQVREIASLLATTMPKSCELRLQLDKQVSAVQGDAAQLHQVLMNLVTNAAESIGEREGSVTVSLDLEEISEGGDGDLLGQESPAPGRYVRMTVADTGSGMEAKTLSRIFDPFFSTKATGRGLGLAAVLGIVRSHRGALRIETAPGAGTRFQVLLPAAGARAVAQPRAPDAPHAPGKGTILVIDDERFVRTATCRMIASLGYDVLEAEDGVRGIEIFRARKGDIDAILLDLTMPRMSGEETLRELVRLDASVRVIVFSGYAADEVAERLSAVGPSGVLQKPFSTGQLSEALRDVLQED